MQKEITVTLFIVCLCLAAWAGDTTKIKNAGAGGIWQFRADRLEQSYAEGVRYATGLHNVMGLDWNYQVNELFVVQHGRDQLDMFPEYFTQQQNAVIPAKEMFMVKKAPIAADLIVISMYSNIKKCRRWNMAAIFRIDEVEKCTA